MMYMHVECSCECMYARVCMGARRLAWTANSRACFKKNSSLHIWPKNLRTTFFLAILPQNLQFLSFENSDDLFFSHHPFFTIFSVLPYFHILHMMNPIPIFCTLYTPYIHTHILFSRFYTLLCALLTVDTAYTIYFFLIHHCTNSLSSLHIFVHHCTFCASLHTKTSPVFESFCFVKILSRTEKFAISSLCIVSKSLLP